VRSPHTLGRDVDANLQIPISTLDEHVLITSQDNHNDPTRICPILNKDTRDVLVLGEFTNTKFMASIIIPHQVRTHHIARCRVEDKVVPVLLLSTTA
jgi:hypothetical protein